MDHQLLKTIELENKLTLNLYDESIKMIGDRWLVTMVARIKIPVDVALIPENQTPLPSEDEIKKILGENVIFEQKNNRIFVDQTDKEDVLEELSKTFIENTISYLSHHDFPRRFLAKKLKDEMSKRSYKR